MDGQIEYILTPNDVWHIASTEHTPDSSFAFVECSESGRCVEARQTTPPTDGNEFCPICWAERFYTLRLAANAKEAR